MFFNRKIIVAFKCSNDETKLLNQLHSMFQSVTFIAKLVLCKSIGTVP